MCSTRVRAADCSWPFWPTTSAGLATAVMAAISASSGPGSFTMFSVRSSMARAAAMSSNAAARRCFTASWAASSFTVVPLTERDLETAVHHAGTADRAASQRVGQNQSPPVGPHPHQQLAVAAADLELVGIEERKGQRQHGTAAVAPTLDRQRFAGVEQRGGVAGAVEHA